MSEPQPPTPVPSEEFFIRVNDFIEAANRIERRFDTRHAEMVLLHACARYSAHHYRSTVKVDTQAEREAFANHVARGVEELVMNHLAHMAGEPQGVPAADAVPEADAGAEPASE